MVDPRRFLEAVKRQLGARDARLEFGGEPLVGPRVVFADLGRGWRVVVTFDDAIGGEDARRQKLRALGAAFPGIVDASVARLPVVVSAPVAPSQTSTALDELLETVAALIDAHWVGVIDTGTEVFYGSSLPRGAVGDEDPLVQRAVSSVRGLDERRYHVIDEGASGAGAGWLARPFGGVYWVLAVFRRAFSEVAAGGQLVRAQPLIETRVAALCPRDPEGPGSGRGNVVRLRG